MAIPLAAILGQCFAWFYLVRSYRLLNSAKYQVVGVLEERLPASPFWGAEWWALGEGTDRARYWPLSHIEQWIPILFGLGSSPLFLLEFVREFQTAHDLYPLLDHEPLATDASGLIDGGYIRLKLPLSAPCAGSRRNGNVIGMPPPPTHYLRAGGQGVEWCCQRKRGAPLWGRPSSCGCD